MVSIAPSSGVFADRPHVRQKKRVLIALTWWEERIVSGIARFAAEHDWLLDCSLRLRPHVPKFAPWDGSGIIAYTGISQTHQALADFLRASSVPKVCLHTDRNVLQAPNVIMDQHAIGDLAADHLVSLRLEHFAFVHFDDNAIETRRRHGFETRLTGAGHTGLRLSFAEFVARLPDLRKPIGIMAANDVNAMDVISACLAAGLRVPEDVAVIGVDNCEISSRISPVPITSVACDFERQGYEAAALLERSMAGEEVPATSIVVPPLGVVVRKSTDTIAIADSDTAEALRFLRGHFQEPIRIKELRQEMRGRMRRVQALFRAETGRTMAEELQRLRIEHAKKLLARQDLKIEFVARQSGFASRFHFAQAFRRVTGQTPTSFRNEARSAPKETAHAPI